MSESKVSVWIRGLVRERGHWGGFVELYKKSFPSHRIEFIDLPGSGENRHMKCPLSIEEMLPLVREPLKRKVGDAPLNLFAMSLGGMLSMEWMKQFPQELESAVLMNTSSRSLSPFYERLQWGAYSRILKTLFQSKLRQRELQILSLISNATENHEEIASQWAQMARERPVSYENFGRQLLAASRFSPPDELAPLPVLLLVGLGDRLVEPKCSYELQNHFGWKLKAHPWAGHDLPIDDGAWVIDALRQFYQVR